MPRKTDARINDEALDHSVYFEIYYILNSLYAKWLMRGRNQCFKIKHELSLMRTVIYRNTSYSIFVDLKIIYKYIQEE